ncbi:MAG TPA: two-component regulator propeller domain-containing protein [Anaeromyxobacter sp.]|nr:two-component regulator propeller domain-containing protein [Anaeromyxobacter sp.]
MRAPGGRARGPGRAAILALALAAPAGALDGSKPLRHLGVRTWTTEDGLPQSSVTAIAQTPDGYLWLGTQVGLVRFDGVRFSPLEAVASAPAVDTVTVLEVDDEGRLWVGTAAGALLRVASGSATIFTGAPGLPYGQIDAIVADPAGLLVAADGALLRLEGDRFRPAFEGLPDGRVQALARAPDGSFWIALDPGGLVQVRGGTVTTFTRGTGLVSENVRAVTVDKGGRVWVGTREGEVQVLSTGRSTVFGAAAGLARHPVNRILDDRHGTTWIATSGGGACRLAGERCEKLTVREGLGHDHVVALLEDDEGGVWIGTDGGGVTQLRDGPVTTFTTSDGLASDEVASVFEDRDGNVWVGTFAAGTAVGRAGAFRPAGGAASIPGVVAMAQTPDGDVWLGTREEGLFRVRGGRVIRRGAPGGLPSSAVYALAAGPSGELWVGLRGGGLARLRDGRVERRWGRADGLPDDRVTMLRVARDGSLWAATAGGLFHLAGDRHEVVELSNRRPRVAALWVHEDARGDLWVGTEGLGLARVRGGRVTTYGEREGLPESVVFTVLEDPAGSLWLSGNRGILRVAKEDLDAFDAGRARQVRCSRFGRRDGMRTGEANGNDGSAATRTRDGRLWFATMGGLATIDPSRLSRERSPPKVRIESFLADGEERVGPGVRLRARTEHLHVRYTAPSFAEPDELRFRYRLDGFDRDWVEAGERREAFYTNVSPGKYVFRVEARTGDARWEPAAPLAFTVETPFFQTPWFALLAAIGVAFALLGADRLRLTRLEARRRELERLVEARTAELAEANRALERLSATDPLTGVANRRTFDAALDSQWHLAARSGAALSIAMVDIDAFKAFQDAKGHQAGDECLAAVARALAALVPRSTDLVARYGGEEFAVVLPSTDASGASHVAERLRRGIEELGIPRPAGGVITVSVGVATAERPQADGDPRALVARADRAMYRAKQQGKNRVAKAGDDVGAAVA